MSMTSDAAANKIEAIFREIGGNKNAQIESFKLHKEGVNRFNEKLEQEFAEQTRENLRAANKIASVIRDVEASKAAEIESARLYSEELKKGLEEQKSKTAAAWKLAGDAEADRDDVIEELASVRGLLEESKSEVSEVNRELIGVRVSWKESEEATAAELGKSQGELQRVRGLLDERTKEFEGTAKRLVEDLNARGTEIIRLGKQNRALEGEITLLKDAYSTLKADSARALVEASETKEIARKAYEEEIDNLKGKNDALSAKIRGKGPAEEATRGLAKEAAEALRERTYQEWDRKKYLGLLDRLDEAAEG